MEYRLFGRGMNTSDFFARCRRANLTAIVSGQDEDSIKKCRENCIDYYICSGAFNCSDKQYFCRNINTEAVRWFDSGCPNRKFLREKNLTEIKMLAQTPGIKGIIIDGARFASPASAEGIDAYFTCFCDDCMRKMHDLDFDAAAIKNSVKALYDLSKTGQLFNPDQHIRYLADWLKFRRLSISSHFMDVRRTIKAVDPDLEFGAYVFPPLLSELVGQNYDDLARVCDFLSPMIYRHYKHDNGPACLDHEIGAITAFLADKPAAASKLIIEIFGELTGTDFSGYGSCENLKLAGVSPKLVGNETTRACILANGTKIIPIILLDDVMLADVLAGCRTAPINSIDFFQYEEQAFDKALPLLII